MKTIKILFTCLIASVFVTAQNVPPLTLEEVEVSPPEFAAAKNIDVQNPFHQYLTENFHHQTIIELVHEGTEVVQFTVNPSGKLSDFKVINSVSKQIDKELIRVLKTTNHMWIPGQNNGVPVAMEREIAIAVKTGESNAEAVNKHFTRTAQAFFTKGAKKLLIQGKTKSALKNFEVAIRYKPYDRALLMMHALCKMDLGENKAAKQDLARIKKLGGIETSPPYLTEDIKKLKTYAELTELLAIQ